MVITSGTDCTVFFVCYCGDDGRTMVKDVVWDKKFADRECRRLRLLGHTSFIRPYLVRGFLNK